MHKYKALISRKTLSLTLVGAIAVAASPGQLARAASLFRIESQGSLEGNLVGLTFEPPADHAPKNTVPGGTRGESDLQTQTSASHNVQFEPPGDATPVNTAAGGTRASQVEKLVALIPDNNHGRTVEPRPTFFVYMPPTSATEVFFSLQDKGRENHYYTTLAISGEGGVVSVTLPADAPELEIGKDYQWFLMAIEPESRLGPNSIGVSGWVKRVQAPAENVGELSLTHLERASLYASSGIWYDTLKELAVGKIAQPDNTALAGQWQALLEQVGLEDIAAEPLAEQF